MDPAFGHDLMEQNEYGYPGVEEQNQYIDPALQEQSEYPYPAPEEHHVLQEVNEYTYPAPPDPYAQLAGPVLCPSYQFWPTPTADTRPPPSAYPLEPLLGGDYLMPHPMPPANPIFGFPHLAPTELPQYLDDPFSTTALDEDPLGTSVLEEESDGQAPEPEPTKPKPTKSKKAPSKQRRAKKIQTRSKTAKHTCTCEAELDPGSILKHRPLSQHPPAAPAAGEREEVDVEQHVRRGRLARLLERPGRNGAPRRPMNPFMLYRWAYQRRAMALLLAETSARGLHPHVSRLVGLSWRLEGEDLRERFTALAAVEKADHCAAFPGYRFRPRRAGRGGRKEEAEEDEDEDEEYEGEDGGDSVMEEF
ncbi:hypothetical protein F4778DRAFT_731114 [Xylariomycetidae sp. FL2044]|nr:hypothetical protein F4778DRAFT_731114 [Xylariomycetidae sp. FL2044]